MIAQETDGLSHTESSRDTISNILIEQNHDYMFHDQFYKHAVTHLKMKTSSITEMTRSESTYVTG